jgi:HD-GYP domain-containing protein (c-di-GMP phosphodiesterase class II)
MTAERCYKQAMTRTDAIAEVRRCAGSQFAPRVVEAFVAELNAAASGRLAA